MTRRPRLPAGRRCVYASNQRRCPHLGYVRIGAMEDIHLGDPRAASQRSGAPDNPASDPCVQLTRPHTVVSTLILIGSVAILAGCSSSAQKREAQKLERLGIVSNTAPLPERLVTQAEVNSASDTAAVQTFLHMWSVLQFVATDQVEEIFEPELRQLIGPSLLAAAIEGEVIIWQATKPKILSS